MSFSTTVLLGAIAGFTIYLGLPVARLRGLSSRTQGFLNALATGILVFLLWDILSAAGDPLETALDDIHSAGIAPFAVLAAIFAGGLATGLLSLVYFTGYLTRRFGRLGTAPLRGPGAAVAARVISPPSARWLALMIASGLGLHNFSEGLAIGQSAATGAIAFAAVLVIGFGLHKITEGFGIAAPLASDVKTPSWGFLGLAGLIGGGPTFLGTVVGYTITSPYVFVLFLTLAAGALLFVINELFNVGRRMNSAGAMAWGLILGFLAGYSTDLLLKYWGG